jgi:hypothetical protein
MRRVPYALKGARIRMDGDRRRFTPIARPSYKWERLYQKRTSFERVNSRLDVSYGFERHTIRGDDAISSFRSSHGRGWGSCGIIFP